MSDKFEINSSSISVNIVRVITGIILVIAGIFGYKKNDKKNKYISLASVLSTIFGGVLLVTELEEDFKPIEEDDTEN